MHPILFQFQLFGRDNVIGTYGVTSVAALCVGVLLTMLAAKIRKEDPSDYFNYAILIESGAMLGAFIAGFFLFLPERLSFGFLTFPPVLVSWGGIAGGMAVVAAISYFWDVDIFALGDISAPAFLTGIGIGRIGCLFGGCCYGIHADTPFSITFTHPLAPATYMQQPLVPVQLISAVALVSGGIACILLLRVLKTRGCVLVAALIYYSLFRFVIEYWRADPRKFILGFSDGQIFSMALFAFGLISASYIFFIKRKHNH